MIPFVNLTANAGGSLGLYLMIELLWNRFGPQDSGHPLRKTAEALKLVARTVIALLVLETLIATLVLPATYIADKGMLGQLADREWEVFAVPVNTSRGTIDLSAASFQPKQGSIRSDMAILFLCPNGAGFEQLASYLEMYATDAEASRIIAFNFRGVGNSEGWPRSSQDLLDDASAVMQYALDNFDLEERNLIVHGWSLGGAVALGLRKQWPKVTLVSDRSFSKLSNVAVGIMEDPISSAGLGLLVGFLLSFVLAPNFSTMMNYSKLLCAITAGVFMAGGAKLLIPFALDLFKWDIDNSHESFLYSGPTCCIFHKKDGMITYDASLHRTLDLNHDLVHAIELMQEFNNPIAFHMYIVRNYPQEWSMLLGSCVRSAFESRLLLD